MDVNGCFKAYKEVRYKMDNVDKMNSYKRVMNTLEGRKPDVTPVVPIIREWCCEQAGVDFVDEFESVETHVYSQMYSLKNFGYDVVYALIGTHAESEAMGSVIKIQKGYPPSVEVPAIEDYETDMPMLKLFDPYVNERLKMILEGTRRLKKFFDGKVPVVFNVRAPFTHASLMRGPDDIARDIFKHKEELHELLELALHGCVVYAVAAISAGADIILVGDAMASGDILSRKHYVEFSFNYLKRLVASINRSGVKTILHTCGDTTDRVDLMAATGAHCLSLDMAVDLGEARKIVGPNCCLMGNISTTTLASGDPKAVEKETIEAIQKAGKDGHLLISGGCLIQNCDAENMRAMIKAAKEYRI